jgi:HPt (histidine-containing phosphotransfer) domain-containing protein
VLLISATWLLVVVGVLFLGQSQSRVTRQIDEVRHSLENFRQTLFLSEPHRANLVQQLELDLQLVQSQTLLIADDSPLINDSRAQLVYSLNRFVEQSHDLIELELQISNFAHYIEQKKNLATPQLSPLYSELASIVLKALFNNELAARDVYQSLEGILLAAEEHPESDRAELQKATWQASTLLSNYAQIDFLVDRLIRHPVYNELALSRDKVEKAFLIQLYSIILISIISILWLSSLIIGGKVGEKARISLKSQQTDRVSTPKNRETEQVSVAPSLPSTGNEPAIDSDKMLETLDNDPDAVLLLLRVFTQEHENDIDKLKACLGKNNEEAIRIAHTLKGVAGSLYADQLRLAASSAELALKQSGAVSPQQISELSSALVQALTSAHHHIQRYAESCH